MIYICVYISFNERLKTLSSDAKICDIWSSFTQFVRSKNPKWPPVAILEMKLITNWYRKLCNTIFLLILAWRIHFWHRFSILASPAIKIQDGRLRPYWKCNLTVNGHRNPCNITFPTKCGIESPFLASFLYFDESKYQISRWPPSTNSIFSVLRHITHIICWISHEKLVFSYICLVPGIICCILTSPSIKIQDGHQRPYWKFNSKKIVLETGIISLFLSMIAHRAHFWHHLCILTGLNVKTQDGRPLPFPLFSDLSHPIHCSCWMSYQKIVSSNICAGAHVPGMLGTFSPPPRTSNPDMHLCTCVTHVPRCMPGSLTCGFLWIRQRRKTSRHS